ncbi:DMT family transporter [Clostridium estertheticum]|uniref:DMT family transporter n=1 Tax=Clostridium estertheticum TaxID=238834 RepID=UPI0013E94352|nr:DMT family transporter [Clostridium estertheticum]MBZ9685849.1 DMT family transporter [Clostridium estertheticum]
MKKYIGELGLLSVAIIWGMGFVASRVSLDSKLTPFQIMTLRFFISTVLMAVIYRKNLKKINSGSLKAGIILGFFLFLAFAFQTEGLQYTTPSKNAFLTSINVVMVPFIGTMLFKKPVDKFGIIGALLACTGAGILTLNGSFKINTGDMLTIICALGFAFHIFFVGEYVKKYDAIMITIIQLAVAFILSLIAIIVMGQTNIHLNSQGVLAVSYLGIFSTALAFLLQNVSQRYTTGTRAAIILSTESVFGALASVIFLGEQMTLKILIGCLLIFVAIITSETKFSFFRKSKALK